MPGLVPTEILGTVIWMGRVSAPETSIRSVPQDGFDVGFAGVAGEAHAGLTRASCGRVTVQYPRGTTIRNVRQFSVVSGEQLAAIAEEMGLAALDPAWLGASLVISGLPDFSHVPPSSRLQFAGGAVLVVVMDNRPCEFPAKEIDRDRPGFGKAFKPAAAGRRGVTAWVERERRIRLGDSGRLHIPDQPVWVHLAVARGA